MYMLTIGLLTVLDLAVGASFGKALGVAVGSYFTACIIIEIIKGALRK
ncbi:gene 0.5 [Escherichia phage T7]|uniref:Gene 0.5 n=1 Tax=Escherichia phage T7 TaxID=10760 RepID=Q6WYL3_BPT7|nr:gene 0.5 [Escherichia phage T7]